MALPARIEDGLRGVLGIPTSRVEALRQLVRELRSCRGLAVAADADRGGVLVLLDAAMHGAQSDLDRAEARALAAAVYQPEVQ